MAATLRDIAKKPLSDYTDADAAKFHSLSVEEALNQGRRALALVVVLNTGLTQADDLGIPDELSQDAAAALSELCEDAWKSVAALSAALPARIGNKRLVSAEQQLARDREDEGVSRVVKTGGV